MTKCRSACKAGLKGVQPGEYIAGQCTGRTLRDVQTCLPCKTCPSGFWGSQVLTVAYWLLFWLRQCSNKRFLFALTLCTSVIRSALASPSQIPSCAFRAPPWAPAPTRRTTTCKDGVTKARRSSVHCATLPATRTCMLRCRHVAAPPGGKTACVCQGRCAWKPAAQLGSSNQLLARIQLDPRCAVPALPRASQASTSRSRAAVRGTWCVHHAHRIVFPFLE